MTNQSIESKSFFNKFLNFTEKAGNALPHPATLFAIMALLVIIFSGIADWLNWQAIHPGTGETITPINLINEKGIVMVAMLGIGIAEGSGLISAVIRLLVLSAPKHLLTFILVFSGVISNLASDVGYVLLIPLAGVIFIAVGRHPLAGMAAAFAGVSGGFSANLFLGTVDPLLAGLSEEAARIIDPLYSVNPTANYYFMFVSTFFISIVGTWVTEKIVEPRLGKYTGEEHPETIDKLTRDEKRGMLYSLMAFGAVVIVVLSGIIPENGFLRGDDGGMLSSPVIKGVVAMLFIVAGLCGIAYGIGSGKYKNDSDVVNGMGKAMQTLGLYLVLVFFAAQFVAYFKWTNLGIIFAVQGANILKASGVGVIPLMIMFIIFSAMINMLMGSASAKWALMAPIFIPMFMLLGYSPELTQAVYRIGDSITNIISPMMSFFALIIAFFQKYEPKTGIGTIISTMLPFTIAFFIVWAILLVGWLLLGLPIGPDAGLYYNVQ
jgi:aminobenzoyl-glutamate transport protein